MFCFKIKVVEHVVEVHAIYARTKEYCRAFYTIENPDTFIYMSQSDIDDQRRQQYALYGNIELIDDLLEISALLRKISEKLLFYDILLLHGALVSYKQEGYLFTGKSGTGKTTHVMKWLERASHSYIVNGDKPFLSLRKNQRAFGWGSPWAGKENMYTNRGVPLKCIVFMERNNINQIDRINANEAFESLLECVYRPNNRNEMKLTLELLRRLCQSVLFYRFKCNNLAEDSFDISFSKLTD